MREPTEINVVRQSVYGIWKEVNTQLLTTKPSLSVVRSDVFFFLEARSQTCILCLLYFFRIIALEFQTHLNY